MQSKQPPVIVIRYVLMIKGLGYNTSYYHNMNIGHDHVAILMLGMYIMSFT
jgi:hypothetical protein